MYLQKKVTSFTRYRKNEFQFSCQILILLIDSNEIWYLRLSRESTWPVEYLKFSINFHTWKWEQNVWALLLYRNPSNGWKWQFSLTLSFHKLHYFTRKVYFFAILWKFKTSSMFLDGIFMSNTKSHIIAFPNLIDQFGSQWSQCYSLK